ncbi:uncharacterized protein PGTG_12596 [Puccinia graminis f. sp. tritici CRL 75-36-700-3]|uniref:Uncharacterized protein n=1 Tax=Puccinia graminis f. sp. tritici (strain CRL 75-36-700-3 / race SCCL) TaxID=418459 RepID=E3KUT9_PUCGT|nr:uncharacterized protein PGTG_12596 [Puccinia graminis f. sp. tritici CRL 75-36-700-3]EFP88149.1 hypothetical protein PGTG_12596 [Puccinia graminis f. sp. tritici CRL 75-36-700-3]
MAFQLWQTYKHLIFRTHYPNHIWACDGHKQLKSFGMMGYGFLGAWSCQFLGLHLHVTNNAPQHLGITSFMASIGGINVDAASPLTVTLFLSTVQELFRSP